MNDTRLSREMVLQHEAKLLDAMKLSDVAALDQLLHDDLLFITPGGQTITKQMDLDAHRARQMQIHHIKPEYEQINLIGDVAVITLTFETKGMMLNQPIEGIYRYIRVWKMNEGHCKVIAGSCIAT